MHVVVNSRNHFSKYFSSFKVCIYKQSKGRKLTLNAAFKNQIFTVSFYSFSYIIYGKIWYIDCNKNMHHFILLHVSMANCF